VDDIFDMRNNSASWDKYFILTEDLDLAGYIFSEAVIASFTGVFDGNNHTISNLAIDTAGANNGKLGLFGNFGSIAEIKNLGVEDVSIVGGDGSYFGGLVGSSSGTVSDCYFSGDVNGIGDNVGGLVGGNGGIVSNCYSTGSVSGYYYTGGLVGRNSGIVSNCDATGSVSGHAGIGGLVGWNDNFGSVSNCYATSSATANDHDAWQLGGLVGVNGGAISNSYSTEVVSGGDSSYYLGGLVGSNYGNGTISKCYSTGVVSGGDNSYILGGLVGDNRSIISNCYSTGTVSGGSSIGGLVGLSSGTISNCYSTGVVSGISALSGLVEGSHGINTNCFWDTETSGMLYSDGGTGLATSQMQDMATFVNADWDFIGESENGTENIWRLCADGVEYPKFNWQMTYEGDFLCPDGVDGSDLQVFCEEWLYLRLPMDLSGDDFVNFIDWTIFAADWQTLYDIDDLADFTKQWLKTGKNDLIADIAPRSSGDGMVNFLDFTILAENWLAGVEP